MIKCNAVSNIQKSPQEMEIMIKKLKQEVFMLKSKLIGIAQASGETNLLDLKNLLTGMQGDVPEG